MRKSLIVALLCFCGTACAPDAPEEVRDSPTDGSVLPVDPPTAASTEDERCGRRIDTNQNGTVEEVEYLSYDFAFDNWDVNNDGSVARAEFERCWPTLPFQNGEAVFRAFDEDNNASLSEDEFFPREDYPLIAGNTPAT